MILDTFYTVQDFGTATRRTYPIINVRLLPSGEGVAAGGAFNLPAAHIISHKENLCTTFSRVHAWTRIHPQPINGRGFLLTYCKVALWLWLEGVLGVVGFLPWVPQIFKIAEELNGRQDSYLGVGLDRIGYSFVSIMGVGGQGSYFWGSVMTPWERWPTLQFIMVAAMIAVWVVGFALLWKRGLFSLLCVLSLFGGTILVGALLSLVSAGYAERTVFYGLLGWVLVVGVVMATPPARAWQWVGYGALGIVAMFSMLSLWAMYSGGDKQHWRELAAEARAVAESGQTVVMYPEVTGLLLDLYYPGEFDMSLNVSDYGALPEKVSLETGTKSVWLAYIATGLEHAGGLDGVRAELEERGYRRVEHLYFWNPMWLDHYEIDSGQSGDERR
jgi:hypothetical protein